MTALACNDVTLALSGRVVLQGVTLAVAEGEFIGVFGPNGAGKTTLMRAVLGLVTPVGGSLHVLGRRPARGNAQVGYMPQGRADAGARLSGWDFVAGAAGGHRWGLPVLGRAGRREVGRALALVGAEELAARPIQDLSGGERQRLLLAQALLGRPRLLLLDEPLISLDPRHQAEMVEVVQRVRRELGIAVLFSAHDLNPLLRVLDRVLYLGGGGAAIGTVEEVVTGPVLSLLYGSAIDVVRLGDRIFVMSGQGEMTRNECRRDV